MDIRSASPVALAYLGDAVIEIFVREALVQTGVSDTGKLSEMSRAFVKACTQSDAIGRLLNGKFLSEEEESAYKRGKNAHISSHPKHQTVMDYRRATGFESLMGWLYMTGKPERCREIFTAAYGQQLEELKNHTV